MKGTYLKKSILLVPTKLNNKEYFKVLTTYEWLTMPENRMVDVAMVAWDDNAFFDSSYTATIKTNVKVISVYTDMVRNQLTGELLSSSCGTEEIYLKRNYVIENSPDLDETLDSGNFVITNHKMYAFVDLMDDTLIVKDYERELHRREVEYISVIMRTYIRRNADRDNVTLASYYYHTKAKQVYDIKGIKYKFNSNGLKITEFVLRNLNCVKDKITVVKENGSCEIRYYFK